MDRNIFRYIFRHSAGDQFALLLMAVASFPFLYVTLTLPKVIVNRAIGGSDIPHVMFRMDSIGLVIPYPNWVQPSQVSYLFVLCGAFLVLVIVNGTFKYHINVFQGTTGERMLRRLRFLLIHRVTRFPLSRFRQTSPGEVVAMVTTETEPLGGFFGEALALPAYQGGYLLTIMVFMFVQDWKLGLAAVALYPMQGYLIPRLQRQVNRLGKRRIRTVRALSEHLGELVTGAHEIHVHDTSQYELARFSRRLGEIFAIRKEIYRKKFFIKFLNNFLAQLTPFLFFAIGGYLVIDGDLTIGALVAVLAAYKEMTSPWKEVLAYYQRKEDARIKYEQLIEQFQPPDLLPEELQTGEPEFDAPLAGDLVASNLTFAEEEGVRVLDGASMSMLLPGHLAVVGSGRSGKESFAKLLSRQIFPTGGRLTVGEHNIAALPETVTGRRIAYAGKEPYIGSGTIEQNMLYGLRHRPQRAPERDEGSANAFEEWCIESRRAGNLAYDLEADWVDYDAAGCTGADDLEDRLVEVLREVDLDGDIFLIGLRRTIDPVAQPQLAERILQARVALRERLVGSDTEAEALIEPFDKDAYNFNASVAENILFGTPVGDTFAIERLGEHPFVRQVFDQIGLTADFVEMSRKLAEMMVEIFNDLPPGHEFFERYGFIDFDELVDLRTILRRIERDGIANASEADRAGLMALAFRLIPARHRLGLIDESMQRRLLDARHTFAEQLPADLHDAVQFFDADRYNAAASIQDNILFGRRNKEKAQSAVRVYALLDDVIDELDLRRAVIKAGLAFEVGIAGKRLSVVQRQKLALARCLLKRPDIFVADEPLSSLDQASQAELRGRVRQAMNGRSIVWVDDDVDGDAPFDHVISVEGGKFTSLGAEERHGESAPSPARTADESATTGIGREAEVLANIPLFAGLDRSKLKLLAFTSERISFDTGEVLIRQGEVGDRAYIMIEGAAEVVLETPDGEQSLSTIMENQVFGEVALLCDVKRTATVRAKQPSIVLAVSKDVFSALVHEDPEISDNIMRLLAERLDGTLRQMGASHTMFDAGTGLASYSLFADRYRQANANRRRHGHLSALLTLNADRLRRRLSIQDDGDWLALVRQVADRLHGVTRETDTVAFPRGMEFAIILSEIRLPEDTVLVRKRVAEALSKPFVINGRAVELGSQLGLGLRLMEEEDADEALASARHLAVVDNDAAE